MLPAALGDFAVDGLLGEGGSSLVYAARHPDHAGEIALKVLHPDLALSEREIERFLDEARKLKQLDDPGVVTLVASGRLPDGRPFIAMPRLRGSSLGDRLRAAPLTPARALALFRDVGRALAALHAAGLIHRDIKPDNVFWLEPDDRLVLLDLGIARDTESSPSTTTRAGLSRGTPDYMAPERLFGQRASVRTDVYEAALLLYVMLARRPPWEEGDPHGRLDPKVDPRVAATLPPGLAETLEAALSLDPNKRPGSLSELLERIAAASEPAGDARVSIVTAPTAVSLPAATQRESSPPTRVPSGGDAFAPVSPAADSALATRSSSAASPVRIVVTPNPQHGDEASIASAPTELAGLSGSRRAAPRASDTGPGGLAQPTMKSPGQAMAVDRTFRDIEVRSARRSRAPIGIALALATAGIAAAVMFGWKRAAAKDGASPGDAHAAATPDGARDDRDTQGRGSDPASGRTARDETPSASAAATAPAPSASASPAVAPSASASASAASTPAPVGSAGPSATAPAPITSAAPTASAPKGATSPSCAAFVALMCSPTSGARPEECTAWKKNVADWTAKYPPDVADQTCAAALSSSQGGLAARKNWKP